jgi:uncharacterized membrane protein
MDIGKEIGLNDEKGVAIAVFLVLVIVSALAAGYFASFPNKPQTYNSIYLLEMQKKAADYPVTLVAGQNSTFSVYLTIENHMNQQETYQVQTKITSDLINVPVDTAAINTTDITLNGGQSWQSLQTITENQTGPYSVVFELWGYSLTTLQYEFTYNYCVLNIQVIS